MDNEIAKLEARRNKYKLIKSGMMQKLLTGQIRLVKPLAPIIPLETPDAQIREIPLQTHVVAGHIVNALYQSSGWGRTKLQKRCIWSGIIANSISETTIFAIRQDQMIRR